MNNLPKINYLSLEWSNTQGQYHRDGDLPAVIYPGGGVEYWKDGHCHRDGDKPAVIYSDGMAVYQRPSGWHFITRTASGTSHE